jgi:tetratricopeptide (TPR) repeat protein
MTVTENVRVQGELRIAYEMLGDPRSVAMETTISIMNRNALTWEDPRVLASFASPNDPAVLDASKFVAGAVRSKTRAEMDSNLQYAIGIYEGLRLSGIAWAEDPQSPYARLRGKPGEVDYIQYPYQTLAYRGGDSDSIAVLYAAELESIGVPAALIPLKDEVLVAFKLSSDELTAKRKFTNPDDFIFMDGEAWLPVSGTVLREGFLRAWSKGAAAAKADPEVAKQFFKLSDAWKRYSPAGVPGVTASARKPTAEQVQAAFDNALSLVVAKEVGPRAEQMRASFGAKGGTGLQRNRLGVLYAQYGMYAEALAEFQASAVLGYAKAAINIGNVAFLAGDFATAAAWFEKSLDTYPTDAAALVGLARSLYELDRFDEADGYFKKATSQSPEVGVRYGYLSARVGDSAGRASAVMDKGGGMLWNEDE